MTPLFLVALMLMHPIYGIIGMIGAGVFVVLAILTELVARRPAARANVHSGAVHTETAAAIPAGAVVVELGVAAPHALTLGQLGITLPPPATAAVESMSSISPAILRPAVEMPEGSSRSTRLSWNIYPNYDEALQETRAAGMWSEETRDFAWFVVWKGGICRGLAWATEFLLGDAEAAAGGEEAGESGGKWRVSGVRWDGRVVEGP